MLIQELISSTNESKPTLASGLSGGWCNEPNKGSGTRSARREGTHQSLIVSSGSKCFRETLRETTTRRRRKQVNAITCPSHWLQRKSCIWSQPRVASVKLKRLCSHLWCHRIPPVPAFFSWPPLKRESERECARDECAHLTESEKEGGNHGKTQTEQDREKARQTDCSSFYSPFPRMQDHLSHVT